MARFHQVAQLISTGERKQQKSSGLWLDLRACDLVGPVGAAQSLLESIDRVSIA